MVHDQWVCSEYDVEFAEIWQGTFGKLRSRHEPSPRNNTVDGISVRALFAPDHAPEMEIMKQILKAKERVDFAIFTFAKSSEERRGGTECVSTCSSRRSPSH